MLWLSVINSYPLSATKEVIDPAKEGKIKFYTVNWGVEDAE